MEFYGVLWSLKVFCGACFFQQERLWNGAAKLVLRLPGYRVFQSPGGPSSINLSWNEASAGLVLFCELLAICFIPLALPYTWFSCWKYLLNFCLVLQQILDSRCWCFQLVWGLVRFSSSKTVRTKTNSRPFFWNLRD